MLMVIIDALALSGLIVMVTVWMVGSGHVQQLEVNATRCGCFSAR